MLQVGVVRGEVEGTGKCDVSEVEVVVVAWCKQNNRGQR